MRAFVLDRHPFALDLVSEAFDAAIEVLLHRSGELERSVTPRPREIEDARGTFREEVIDRLEQVTVSRLPEPTPGVTALERLAQATEGLLTDIDGFLRRESIRASLTLDERRELLAGMVLTRAVDNRLKQFFLGGEVRWDGKAFQGKGFRSLGQEAI